MNLNNAQITSELGAEALGTSVNPVASGSAKMPQAERQQTAEQVQETERTEPLRPREVTAIEANSRAERVRLQAAVSAYLRRQEDMLELMERNLRPLLSAAVVAAPAEKAAAPFSGEQRFDRELQTSLISTGEVTVTPVEVSPDNTGYSVLEQSLSTNHQVARQRRAPRDAFEAQMAIAPSPIAEQDPALAGTTPPAAPTVAAADPAGEPVPRAVGSEASPARMPAAPEQALRQAIEESLAALRLSQGVGREETELASALLDKDRAGRAEVVLRALEERQMTITFNNRGRSVVGLVPPMLLDTAR